MPDQDLSEWTDAVIVPQSVQVRKVTDPRGETYSRNGLDYHVKPESYLVRTPEGLVFQCSQESFDLSYAVLPADGAQTGAMTTLEQSRRIDNAICMIRWLGGCEGSHHQLYCIDQILRALMGGSRTAEGADGLAFSASPEYTEFVRKYCNGQEGPDTYTWDVGQAP